MDQDKFATYSNVNEMASRLGLSDAAYRRAFEIARLSPDLATWRRYIDHFLTTVGALLIVAGVAAFFAWNWAELGAMAKFALIQIGFVGCVILAWRFGLDSLAGKVSLFAAAFFTGTLLAIFGQVYQTGADPYGLFMAWAVLILPFAIIGRQAGLWMLVQILLNLTVIMYYTQVLHPPDGLWELTRLLGPLVWLGSTVKDSKLASYLFMLNVAALVTWEFGASQGSAWMQGRVFPRLIALAALCTVLLPTLVIIFAASFQENLKLSGVPPALLIVATFVCFSYYQRRRQDLFILTCSLLGVISVVTSLAVRFEMDSVGDLLGLALLIIVQVAGAAWWLREVARRWESQHEQ